MDIRLEVSGLENSYGRLDGIANPAAVIDPAVRTWTKGVVLRELYGPQQYPPTIAPGYWAAHTTIRQKRAFFAKLRRGEWTGRTGLLGNSWRAEKIADGIYVIVNAQPYAGWVVGEGTQTGFTKGRWWMYRNRVDDHVPELLKRIREAVVTYWQRGRYGI
jgi:hypothetical protein